MEKKHKPKEQIYVSDKILGQLYDKVESVDFIPHYESPFDKRILRAYPEDRATLKTARQIKSQYDTAMRRIMAQHNIETEFEVWTSFVLSKPRVGTDYKVQEEMGIISSTLKERFKEICIEAAEGNDLKALGPFAAAMYQVTCEELAIALYECRTMKTIGGRDVPKRKMEPKSMPLMSFPWIFQSVLGRIATGSEPTTLEDVGLSFVTRNEARGKKRRLAISDENDYEDYIETADGVTHRGELLDLFRPDAVDSDGDEVIPPYNVPDAANQVQDEPQLKYEYGLDGAPDLDVDKETDTKNEHEIVARTNGLAEIIPPKNKVQKYRSTLTMSNLVTMSGSKSSDVTGLSVAINKNAVVVNSLVDISEPQTAPVQEEGIALSSNNASTSEPSMTSLPSRGLEGLEYIIKIATNVPLPKETPEIDISQNTNNPLTSAIDTNVYQTQRPATPTNAVDLLANFFEAKYQQQELLSISESPECSRVSSHCEDLADLGAHCHDLADLGVEYVGSDDGGDYTIIQDQDTMAVDLASLVFAPGQESADGEPGYMQISSANEQEHMQISLSDEGESQQTPPDNKQVPQQVSLADIQERRPRSPAPVEDLKIVVSAAEEIPEHIASAAIQGDSNGIDEYEGESDYGEEVILEIEESALEKLQKLSSRA